MLKNRDINIRNQVTEILGKRKATEAIFPLIDSIHDGPARYEVADAIINMNGAAKNPLLQLLKHPDPEIRSNSAFVLGQMRCPEAIGPLIQLLGDSSNDVHTAASNALGEIGEIAVDDLRNAIHDINPNVKIGSAHALGIISQSNFSTPIMTISLDDVFDEISIEELLADSDIESNEESDDDCDEENDDVDDDEDWEGDDDNEDDEEYLDEDENCGLSEENRDLIVSDLMQLLEDKNPHVREAASSALGMMGVASANPLVEGVSSPDRNVRKESIIALGQNLITNKIPAAIPPLINALIDSDPEIRYIAVKALRYSKEPQTVQPLIDLLRDPYEEIRQEAAEGLRRREDPRIFSALIAALQDDSSRVRLTAACGLGELGDPRGRSALMQALNDGDRYVREIAARSLGMLKSESSMDVFALLNNTDPKLRCGALLTLGEGKDENSITMIVPFLHDPDAEVRKKAAEALCNFSNPIAIPDLVSALDDNNVNVRKFALRALSKIKDQRILSPMIASLKDSHAWVRQEAAWHLAESGDDRAVPCLIEALGDPVATVRRQAAISLGNLGGKTTETLLLDLEQKTRDSKILEASRTALEQLYRMNQYRPQPKKQKDITEAVNSHVIVHQKEKSPEICSDVVEEKKPDSIIHPDDTNDFRECLPLSKRNPHSARQWLSLVADASDCIDKEDYDSAMPLLHKAYTMYPQSEMLLSMMGFTMHNLGQYEDALKIYQYGTEINPENSEFWENIGAILANFEQFDDALEHFDKALSLCSTDDEIWCKKGIVLNNLSHFEEAITAFDMALRINPESEEAKEGKEVAQQNSLR
jgi:HEAT repeat protein